MEEINNTWDIVNLLHSRKTVNSRFILKKKRNSKGEIDRYKVRLVVQGFSQKQGIDYQETFSPVTSIFTILLLLTIAISNDWEIYQMDFNSAYLNTELKEDIYMKIPEQHSANKSDKVSNSKNHFMN